MSNRKKPPQPPAFKPTMSVIPSIYVNQYEFNIDGGLIEIRLGRRGETHADVTMAVSMLLDLCNKVQEKVAAMITKQDVTRAPDGEPSP